MKKRSAQIPDNKYRIIKISERALFEFLYESFLDHQDLFFDVKNNKTGESSIVTEFDIDWNTKEFICVARNELGNNEHLLFPGIDTQVLLSKLKDTTPSLFDDNRYIELTEQQIADIQDDVPTDYSK